MTEEKDRHPLFGSPDDEYMGNIWGWKRSYIALAIILFVLSIAVCRYVMIQPEQLIIPEQVEDF